MRFKVPQFLEIEDKIFGPFTFKQFVYLVGGGGICFVLYKLLGLLLGIIPMLIVAGISLALTFYQPNNKPLIDMVEAGFKYITQNKLYIWKRGKNKKNISPQPSPYQGGSEGRGQVGQRLGKSKLRDLAWSLDVLDLKRNQEHQ